MFFWFNFLDVFNKNPTKKPDTKKPGYQKTETFWPLQFGFALPACFFLEIFETWILPFE